MVASVEDVKQAIDDLADGQRAKSSAWFFKTAPGQYGAGDKFVGVTVPKQRQIAKQFSDLGLEAIKILLQSPVHEHRLCGLLILVSQFQAAADESARQTIYDLYMEQVEAGRVNNWDLVDSSAPQIAGGFLRGKSRQKLYEFARSGNLWQQRVAILATFAFIRDDDFIDSLAIAELLLDHQHDLIHKAVGWMLREIGKRDLEVEEAFLNKHYRYMPRTTLRYAIEKLPENKRQAYLQGTI